MNLNEKLGIEIDQDKSNNDNNIESNNKISIENGINDNNRNQSDESIKTTEYSSEAGELILKYIKSSCKAHHYYKNNKDMIRDNIKKNLQINNTIKRENIENKKTKKSSKTPKFVEYNNDYLKKNNTNINAPQLPINYNFEFRIDNCTNQSKIGEKNYMKKNDIDTYNENKEYKRIQRIQHDKLSHLIINENLYINKNQKNYNKMSVTKRIKHKFLTIIYITPTH